MVRTTRIMLLLAVTISWPIHAPDGDAQNQVVNLTKLGTFDAAHHIAWSGDNLLAAQKNNQIELWYVANEDYQGVYHSLTLPVPALSENVGEVAFSPDGAILAVSAMQETRQPVGMRKQGVIFRWNTQTGTLMAPWSTEEMNIEGDPQALAFNPTSDVLAFGFSGNSASCQRFSSHVALFDTMSGEQLITHDLQRIPVQDLAFSPDGARLAIYRIVDSCVPMAGRVTVLEGDIEVASLEFDHVTGVSSLAFSPDGTRLVSNAQPEWHVPLSVLHVWDTATFLEHNAYELKDAQITALTFVSNTILLIGDETGDLRVFDVNRGVVLQTIPIHTTKIIAIGLNADSTLLATVGDSVGYVWEIEFSQN